MTEMDPDEKKEFRDIEEGIQKEKRASAQNRWKKFHVEKNEEETVSSYN